MKVEILTTDRSTQRCDVMILKAKLPFFQTPALVSSTLYKKSACLNERSGIVKQLQIKILNTVRRF